MENNWTLNVWAAVQRKRSMVIQCSVSETSDKNMTFNLFRTESFWRGITYKVSFDAYSSSDRNVKSIWKWPVMDKLSGKLQDFSINTSTVVFLCVQDGKLTDVNARLDLCRHQCFFAQ